MKTRILALAAALLCAASVNSAVISWTGLGDTDTSWGNSLNWDVAPAWEGSDNVTVTSGFGANTALTLDIDRSISRITFGGSATPISLSNNTLTLTSTATSDALGTALWNASTADGKTATVDSNIKLQSGSAGTYTGNFRENNNSSGGTRFNGTITQGAGENWTLNFNRASARGNFYLNNSGNSFTALRNDGADVYSEVAGAFGGAALTLDGGVTGTRLTDHYTTPVSNNITLTNTSTWVSHAQTRMTGSLDQSTRALNYGNAVSPTSKILTRLEYASVSGSGSTTIAGGTIAPSSMSQFTSGTLGIGDAGDGQGVLVLSGAGGNGVPTWSDFAAARTFNQSGGAGTWRININAGQTGNVFAAGGFAAKDADLVIPASGAGLSNTTFTRNFFMGSAATLDGVRYANNRVTINTDIAYGSVAGGQRFFGAAWNEGTEKTTTSLTLAGPVHELAGQITGDNVILYPMGAQDQPADQFGMIRISNENNSLTGTSRWIIGGQRSTFTTIGGGSIAAPSNMGDKSSVALVFTSDGAFGGATEVMVTAQGSSGTYTNGTLLLEDINGSGSTTFNRAVNMRSNNQNVAPTFGSYGGDVIYTGALTLDGAQQNFIIHAETGSTLAINSGASLTNDNTFASGNVFNKTGGGVLTINSLTVGGTQATNKWNVREGTLAVNDTLASEVTVSSGATLGGTGTVGGATIVQDGGTLAPGNSAGLLTFSGTLNLGSTSSTVMEIDGTSRGVTGGYDAVDVGTALAYGGVMITDFSTTFGPGSYSFDLFDFSIGSESGTFTTISLAGMYSGTLDSGNSWALVSGINTWSFTHSTGVLALDVVPEPATFALLGGLGALGLALFRRRRG